MNQEKIGKFIAECRKGKNITQEQLAEKLGVSNKSISRWENGNTMPDLSILTMLADELDIEVSELLNGERMNKEELVNLRKTVNNVITYSNSEKNKKTSKLNKYFVAGFMCLFVVIIDRQFEVLSFIFKENISDFINGILCGLGLLLELIGFYNNNHDITLRQKKLNFINKK